MHIFTQMIQKFPRKTRLPRRAAVLAKILALTSLLSVASAAIAEPAARIDLNEASVEQLCTLPGVGPKRAKAITEFRKRKRFTRVSQLVLVRGIGLKTLRRLRPLLRVSPHAKKAVDVPKRILQKKKPDDPQTSSSSKNTLKRASG